MWRVLTILATTSFFLPSTPALADAGHPVAVRWWGQAMVSIETYWGLTVVIDPYGEKIGYQNPRVTADLVLVTHEHGDHNQIELIGGDPMVERGLDSNGRARSFSQVLDRMPGADRSRWYDARQRIARSPHALQVTSVPSWHDDTAGSERGANAILVLVVDGVRIVHCGDLGQGELTPEQLRALGGNVDVLLLPVGGVYTIDGQQAADIVRQVQPRIVIPIHYKTPNLIYELQGVQGFLKAVEDDCRIVRANGNTLAWSNGEGTQSNEDGAKPQVVVLNFEPWAMPAELAELFEAKEQACRASQQVFAKLSAGQLNFKPSNGTHTPRWNAEHMMGRELGFFSEIYQRQLPGVIRHLDLNPKQMPPDYVAAHPEWSGAEEARQMERVSKFTRRFAYLLDSLPLDEKASGSSWTPRRLLKQMERHYNEHTANVVKKFELPDWPTDHP